MKVLSVLTVALFASTAHAEPAQPTTAWFQCVRDADCIHIQYTCSEGVVNKGFAKIANEHYALENARRNCTAKPFDEKAAKQPYRLFCERQVCRASGINPKPPGFS